MSSMNEAVIHQSIHPRVVAPLRLVAPPAGYIWIKATFLARIENTVFKGLAHLLYFTNEETEAQGMAHEESELRFTSGGLLSYLRT